MNLKILIGAILNYLFNDVITHIPVHGLRRAFLRLTNRRIHRTTKILLHTRLLHYWNLSTSENVVINQHCLLDCRRYPIHIGNNTDIGPYTRIWTLGHDPESETHEVKGGPVTIGHHVWIASGATILPNVTINDGAVVATGSVVTKSVEKLSIVAGNPAKEIRKRNNTLTYILNYEPIWE
jgi:putative colanic acid biosynthesis acetyltransferase WcaF